MVIASRNEDYTNYSGVKNCNYTRFKIFHKIYAKRLIASNMILSFLYFPQETDKKYTIYHATQMGWILERLQKKEILFSCCIKWRHSNCEPRSLVAC